MAQSGGGSYTENLRIRHLTPKECWRLQGFPDELFDKAAAVNSDTQLYKQAGNGVTVPVIRDIGERLNVTF
jgi:DNA (cytosine-5)-methyltransferase 1